MEPAARRAFVALVQTLLGEPAAPDLDALPADLVRRHLLGPLAFVAGARQFRPDHIASALQAELRAAALQEAVIALRDAHVDVMLLKGVAYAGTIYSDPATRPMSDIDLLVPAAVTDRAAQVLQRLGYWHAGGAHQRSARHHAMTFKRRGAAIDLHRNVVHLGRTRIDLAAVWREAVLSHVPGASRPYPLHERLLHVAHMGRHELSVPLINYVDLARLQPQPDDQKAAESWGLGLSWAGSITCLEMLLDDSITPRWWVPSRDELLLSQPQPRWIQILRKIKHVDGPRGLMGLARAAMDARARRFSVIGRTRD